MGMLNLWLVDVSNWVWSYLMVGLCVFAGLYCTLRLGFVQFRSLPHAWQLLRGKYSEGSSGNDISTFQALATTLASTTGIGNIAGVAVAITLGGPGAIFWMWIMALLGMSLKFVEATLGSLYRRPEQGVSNGALVGGPMYYLAEGLGAKWKPVAMIYAVLAAVAFLGAWNMFQANQAAAIAYDQFSVPPWVTSAVLAVLSGVVLIGGIHRIGQVASRIVPTMCLIYLGGVVVILMMNLERVPAAFDLIFTEAFNTDAAAGGAMGTAILMGIRRAMFSNEAGVGSAAIAFAAAHTKFPVRQGVVASLGPFIDTIIVCTATALVILIGGFFGAESHQPKNERLISFESGASKIAAHWHVTDQYPAFEEPLQALLEGGRVLHFAPVGEGPLEVLNLPLKSLHNETLQAQGDGAVGLRFSLYRQSGAVEAALVSGEGEVISTLLLDSPRHSRWLSFVVPVPDGVEVKPDWSLRITPLGGGDPVIYLDRVQWVASATGIVLSTAAFTHFLGIFGSLFVPFAALLFAYTSIIAGSYYGEVASQYIHGRLLMPYKWLYIASIFIGGVVNLDVVINFSDLFLALACIPNLIAMVLLCPTVAKEQRRYFDELRD